MANLNVLDATETSKYLKGTGAGDDLDPFIPEHKETSAVAILAAVDGVEALLTTIDADTSALAATAGTVAISNATVAVTQSGTWNIGTVTALPNVVVDSGTVTATVANATIASGTVAVTHDALTELAAAIDTEVQVDVVSSALPTGASTAAKQDTIIGHVDGIEALLTTIDADTSTLAAAVSTEMQVDVVGALPAGDNVIGRIGTPDIVVPVTPALDTNAYADGDLLFNSTEITGGVRVNGHTAIIQTITVIDKDDRKTPMTLLFADANTNFGTVNQPPNPSDAAAETVVGHMEITAEDYVDLGGASVACVKAIGMLVKAGAATTSLWIAAISRGTPTHTASGLVIKVGLLRS